jgi:thermitase
MRRMALLLTTIALALLLSSGVALLNVGADDSALAQTPPEGFVPGEVLVKFEPGTSGQQVAEAHRRNGGQVEQTIPNIRVQVVRVPVGQEQSSVAAYERNPNVLFAEVNGLYRATNHGSNDPRVGNQWQYDNDGQTGGTNDADIDAFEAWHVTDGSNTVAISVLDTGIDQSHEDLKAKILKNRNFTTSTTVDDKYGHGTHVAGSAAAITNNGKGVAGTCPNCVLYNAKVLGDNGGGAWSWIANGITWSANNGAEVINMSLGGSSGSNTLALAVNDAWNKGVVLVAAAGNSGVSDPLYPAYYEKVIAVAATDHNDAKASFSNYGTWVDVAAPGKSILSTAPDHSNKIWGRGVKYGTIGGTSMATPHVAGEAGLIWSSSYGTGNQSVRDRIEGTADATSEGTTYWASGRINANSAVVTP